MTEIFSDNANLGGLLTESNVPLKVSDVIHKAFVEVTEKGTEAGKLPSKSGVICNLKLLISNKLPLNLSYSSLLGGATGKLFEPC